MSYRPGDNFITQFTTQRGDNGAAADADETPVASVCRNGVEDATVSATVTHLATGRYRVTGAIPATYQSGDVVQIVVAATVSEVSGVAIVESFLLDAKRLGDLHDFDPQQQMVKVSALTAGALADFFVVDAGVLFGDSDQGSVVQQIALNSSEGWTPAERQQIRQRLGLDGQRSVPETPGGDLPDIKVILQAASRK